MKRFWFSVIKDKILPNDINSIDINSYTTANICCTIHNCTTCRIIQDYGRRPAARRPTLTDMARSGERWSLPSALRDLRPRLTWPECAWHQTGSRTAAPLIWRVHASHSRPQTTWPSAGPWAASGNTTGETRSCVCVCVVAMSSQCLCMSPLWQIVLMFSKPDTQQSSVATVLTVVSVRFRYQKLLRKVLDLGRRKFAEHLTQITNVRECPGTVEWWITWSRTASRSLKHGPFTVNSILSREGFIRWPYDATSIRWQHSYLNSLASFCAVKRCLTAFGWISEVNHRFRDCVEQISLKYIIYLFDFKPFFLSWESHRKHKSNSSGANHIAVFWHSYQVELTWHDAGMGIMWIKDCVTVLLLSRFPFTLIIRNRLIFEWCWWAVFS